MPFLNDESWLIADAGRVLGWVHYQGERGCYVAVCQNGDIEIVASLEDGQAFLARIDQILAENEDFISRLIVDERIRPKVLQVAVFCVRAERDSDRAGQPPTFSDILGSFHSSRDV